MNETKRRLLDSAMQVIARNGWPGLSVRSVANEAKVSSSQVQYHYHARADLIAATYQQIGDKLESYVTPLLDDQLTPDTLLRILMSWIPDTTEREAWARTWVAFSAASLHEEVLSNPAREVDETLRSWLSEQFHELASRGEVSRDLDTNLAARQLLGLIDGLTLQALLLPMSERRDFIQPALIDMFIRLGCTPSSDLNSSRTTPDQNKSM